MNIVEYKKEYHKARNELKLTINEFIVSAGGTLLLLGLREETNDVDADVDSDVFAKLIKSHKTKTLENGTIVIVFNNKVDIHESKPGIEYTVFDGVGSYTAEQVLKQKKKLNRPKDQADIKKLEDYLSKNKHNKKNILSTW